jgi:hypothetical protein
MLESHAQRIESRVMNEKLLLSSPAEFYTGGLARATAGAADWTVEQGCYLLRARVYLPCAVPAGPLLGEIALCCLDKNYNRCQELQD